MMAGAAVTAKTAREAAMAAQARRAASVGKAAGKGLLKKAAVPVEAGMMVMEAGGLVASGERREEAFNDTKALSKRGVVERVLDSSTKPMSTLYGAARANMEAYGAAGRTIKREAENAALKLKNKARAWYEQD